MCLFFCFFFFFFFNDTATTEIYTLSLHDALPICPINPMLLPLEMVVVLGADIRKPGVSKCEIRIERDCVLDRKSTRLNSCHGYISYAVFCLKKKKKKK